MSFIVIVIVIVSNAFWMHTRHESDVLLDEHPEERLDVLNADMRRCHSLRIVAHRMPRVKLENIREGDCSKLMGPVVKAAKTRSLLSCAVGLQRRAVASNPFDINKHALKAVDSIRTVYSLLLSSS